MRIHVHTPERPAEGEHPAVSAHVGRLVVEDAESAAVLRDIVARGGARLVVPADTDLVELLTLFKP
jgi:hypothetical protein